MLFNSPKQLHPSSGCACETFVDPQRGAHNQTIEGFGGNVESAFKSMHGVHAGQRAPHLDELTWRWNNKNGDTFELLLNLLNRYYPCNHAGVPQQVLAQKPDVQY